MLRSRKSKNPCEALPNMVTEFTTESTIHGVRYLTEQKLSLAERVLWFIILLISVIICSVFIFHIIEKWNSSPVIVTFTNRSTLEIPLPALTVCPGMNVRHDRLNISRFSEVLANGNSSESDLSFEELRNSKELLYTVCPNQKWLWSNIDASERNLSDVDMMLQLSMIALPMNQTILACFSAQWTRNCRPLFQRIFTRDGICYTFNGLSPSELYRDNVVYTTKFGDTKFTKPSTWSMEKGYADAIRGGQYPYHSVGGFIGYGMTFLLSIHLNNDIYDCNIEGFKVYLHAPNDVALSSEDFIKVPLATDVRISVSPNMIVTSDNLRDYAPSQRNCYYNTERYLSLFKEYSERNCLLECIANYTLRECGCVSFHVPRLADTNVCTSHRSECILKATDKFQSESLAKRAGEDTCDCKPACTSLTFDSDIQYIPTYSLNSTLKLLKIQNSELYFFSFVSILYMESEFMTLTRSELFGKTDLVASCGGILGLSLAISLISFVEFMYYCAIRPFFHSREKRKRMKTYPNGCEAVENIRSVLPVRAIITNSEY